MAVDTFRMQKADQQALLYFALGQNTKKYSN